MMKYLLGSVLLVTVLAGCTLLVPPLDWEHGLPETVDLPPGRDAAARSPAEAPRAARSGAAIPDGVHGVPG